MRFTDAGHAYIKFDDSGGEPDTNIAQCGKIGIVIVYKIFPNGKLFPSKLRTMGKV